MEMWCAFENEISHDIGAELMASTAMSRMRQSFWIGEIKAIFTRFNVSILGLDPRGGTISRRLRSLTEIDMLPVEMCYCSMPDSQRIIIYCATHFW